LKIKLLPSIAGKQSQLQCLTSFLINDRVSVDGGSIGFALEPNQMSQVRHIIITHTHSDHTASLPIFIAEAFVSLDGPVRVYASQEAVQAMRHYVFNDQIWPNFERIPLLNGGGACLEFHLLEPRKPINIDGLDVTPIPVNHIVPTLGLLIEDDNAAVLFTSDTYCTDEIWLLARQREKLKAVFVDVSFPNELGKLAADSKHLTPELLAEELKKLDRQVEVYAVHIKPTNRDLVIDQLKSLNNPFVSVAELGREYQY
jgi:cAMP phosphodiesterase